jgi:catechol 2,3-dioxygenase-like lactoylglutathione lyase family enzyme
MIGLPANSGKGMTAARELRFAFTFDDYAAALHLFRDIFGLETMEVFEDQGRQGTILRVPSATLEIFDREYGRLVDDVEVGRPLDGRVRIAVNVGDLEEATKEVLTTGAYPVADPVDTPWGDRNRRFRMSDELQLTLFQPPG